MPRCARLRLAGIPLHLVQRGHNRSACFCAERDFHFYLDQLQALTARFECSVHAFVLMTNHVHLLLTPNDSNGVSLLMKHLNQRYVQYFNRCHQRTGTLWEGRYKCCLTQDERYVLTCYRYIELNPVRAGMVAKPRHYRWSSYAANAEGLPCALVTPHEDYLRLGATEVERRVAYRALIDGALDDESVRQIRDATLGNLAFGNAGFQAELRAVSGRRVARGRRGRPARM